MTDEYKRLIYTGPHEFTMHGLKFKKGIVYRVTPQVFEWSKHIRHLCEVIEISPDEPQDFDQKNQPKKATSWKSG